MKDLFKHFQNILGENGEFDFMSNDLVTIVRPTEFKLILNCSVKDGLYHLSITFLGGTVKFEITNANKNVIKSFFNRYNAFFPSEVGIR